MKKTFFAVALGLGALPAAADEIRLRNGAVLEGVAREVGDTYVVDMDIGTMTLRKSDVASVKSTGVPLKDFGEREKNARDVTGWTDLARWAEKNGLPSRSRGAYRKVLEFEPDNTEARRALGYVRYDSRWMTEDEVMAAKGYVSYNGRWVTPQERAKEIELDLEVRERQLKIQAQEEAAEELRRAEMRRANLERQRLEVLRQNSLITTWVPVPSWGQMSWSPYRVSGPIEPPTAGVAAAQQPPASGVDQRLPASGVDQKLPLSGVDQKLPLSGVPQQLPLSGVDEKLPLSGAAPATGVR